MSNGRAARLRPAYPTTPAASPTLRATRPVAKAPLPALDTAANFGGLLKAYRTQLGLSQRTLAQHLGVHESLIAKVETGTRNPPRVGDFWERLPRVPGMTEEAVHALKAASKGESKAPPRLRLARTTAQGLQITIQIQTEGTEGDEYTEADLERLSKSLMDEVDFSLGDLLAHHRRRKRRHPIN